jgi:hypothetical protein
MACRLTKATDVHLEYVIDISFPPQQWLYERASMLLYTYIACLFLQFIVGVVSALHIFWLQISTRLFPFHAFYLFCWINYPMFNDQNSSWRRVWIACLLIMLFASSVSHFVPLKPNIFINTLLSNTTKIWSLFYRPGLVLRLTGERKLLCTVLDDWFYRRVLNNLVEARGVRSCVHNFSKNVGAT